jgi:predicted small lipoprotein YifL
MAEKAQNKGAMMIALSSVGACLPTLASGARSAMVNGDVRRARVVRSSDRRLVRLVAVATIMAAFTLAACGRKGGLDAPPSSLPAPPQQQSNISPSPGESGPGFMGPNLAGPLAGSPPPQQTAQSAPPPKSFFLDWLIK